VRLYTGSDGAPAEGDDEPEAEADTGESETA